MLIPMQPTINAWADSYIAGRQVENQFCKDYAPVFDIKDLRADPQAQQADIDYILTNRYNNTKMRIDVKRQSAQSWFYLEIDSVLEKNKKGWALTSQADYIVIYNTSHQAYYWIPIQVIRHYLHYLSRRPDSAKYIATQTTRRDNGTIYHSRCVTAGIDWLCHQYPQITVHTQDDLQHIARKARIYFA